MSTKRLSDAQSGGGSIRAQRCEVDRLCDQAGVGGGRVIPPEMASGFGGCWMQNQKEKTLLPKESRGWLANCKAGSQFCKRKVNKQ